MSCALRIEYEQDKVDIIQVQSRYNCCNYHVSKCFLFRVQVNEGHQL